MKTPWKYLVEFASLRRAPKEAEILPRSASLEPSVETAATPAPVLVPAALPNEVAEASSTPSPSLDVASSPDIGAAPIDPSDEAAISPIAEPSVVDVPAPKKAWSSKPAFKETRPRTKKTNAINVAEGTALEYGERGSSMQPPLTFGEEVAALDEDVKQLRRRLAEKLRVQNKQLAKLLERYDRL